MLLRQECYIIVHYELLIGTVTNWLLAAKIFLRVGIFNAIVIWCFTIVYFLL